MIYYKISADEYEAIKDKLEEIRAEKAKEKEKIEKEKAKDTEQITKLYLQWKDAVYEYYDKYNEAPKMTI